MKKTYIVRLSDAERTTCLSIIKTLKGSSQKVRRAHILLQADADGPNWKDQDIADAYHCTRQCVENLRKRRVIEGFDIALNGKKRETPPRAKCFDGRQEAEVIVLRMSDPPEGRNGWTLRLLADKIVELEIAPKMSRTTVWRTLKNKITPHKVQYYVIPPEHNAEFVAAKRLEIIPTPKHGSWLNVAENDLSSLTVQCVRHRRFGTLEELRAAVESWAAACNEKIKGIQWHFNVEKARAKLKSLYPIIK